jgi:hypothetical protein
VQSDAFEWAQVLQGAGAVQCRQLIQPTGKNVDAMPGDHVR